MPQCGYTPIMNLQTYHWQSGYVISVGLKFDSEVRKLCPSTTRLHIRGDSTPSCGHPLVVLTLIILCAVWLFADLVLSNSYIELDTVLLPTFPSRDRLIDSCEVGHRVSKVLWRQLDRKISEELTKLSRSKLRNAIGILSWGSMLWD